MADERDASPNDTPAPPMASTAEVAAVVQHVQRAHRGRMRWGVGKHTAEVALRTIAEPRPPLRRPSSSKTRRRKRHKRLL
jgi:hypothetical protein